MRAKSTASLPLGLEAGHTPGLRWGFDSGKTEADIGATHTCGLDFSYYNACCLLEIIPSTICRCKMGCMAWDVPLSA